MAIAGRIWPSAARSIRAPAFLLNSVGRHLPVVPPDYGYSPVHAGLWRRRIVERRRQFFDRSARWTSSGVASSVSCSGQETVRFLSLQTVTESFDAGDAPLPRRAVRRNGNRTRRTFSSRPRRARSHSIRHSACVVFVQASAQRAPGPKSATLRIDSDAGPAPRRRGSR